MSLISFIRGLVLGTMHSTLKLIFLAASILAQVTQRPSPEGNPIEKTGPPHFLHLVGAIIRTSNMTISSVADYKEEPKCVVSAIQSSHIGPNSNGSQKTDPIPNCDRRQIGTMMKI